MQRTLGTRVFFLGVSLLASAARAELAVPPQEAMALMNHLAIHSKNITDEIAAINDTIALRGGAPFVEGIFRQMALQDRYAMGLIQTNLRAIPPRPRSPLVQPRPVSFMVSWRMADLFKGTLRAQSSLNNLGGAFTSGANPAPANADFQQAMQQVINRYSIAVPSTYLYIEAMRRTYLINPCATWPNGELPAILNRLEAQLFVLRQNMDALFIHGFFNPCFPNGWGTLESTFHGFRMDVRTQGPIGIAPMPYFQEGGQRQGYFQPQIQAVPREGMNPVLPYNPDQFGNQWDRFSPGYVDSNGVQPGANIQSFPTAVPQQGDGTILNSGGQAGQNGPPLIDQSGQAPGANGQQPVQNPNAYGPQPLQNQDAYGSQQPQNQNYYGPQQPQNQNYYGQQFQNQNTYGPQQQNQNYYGQQLQNQNYYGQQPQNQNYSGQQLQNQNTYGPQQLQNQNYYGQPQNQNYYGGQQANAWRDGANGNQGQLAPAPAYSAQNGQALPATGVNNADGTVWGWGDFSYPNNSAGQTQRQP